MDGRGDFCRDELDAARSTAAERQETNAAGYLVGMPLLADYLDEGLSQLGHSCDDVELAHL